MEATRINTTGTIESIAFDHTRAMAMIMHRKTAIG
jgi:hypothetical protein